MDAVLGYQDNNRIDILNRKHTSGNRFERVISKWALDALEFVKNHPLTGQIIPKEEE